MNPILWYFNYLRRWFIVIFFPFHFVKSHRERKGECLSCGECCSSCFHLSNNKCFTYANRPFWCNKDFPNDEFELKLYGLEGKCGYTWKRK